MARIVVDRIRCDGRGLCAELLPERITLDEWGYPLVDATPVDAAVEAYALTAVSQCPRLALALVPDRVDRRPVTTTTIGSRTRG
ncbi:MAG TPA: ferredoxin [Mycobacteriales bacterium]